MVIGFQAGEESFKVTLLRERNFIPPHIYQFDANAVKESQTLGRDHRSGRTAAQKNSCLFSQEIVLI